MADIISAVSTQDPSLKHSAHNNNQLTKESSKNFKDALDNETNSTPQEDDQGNASKPEDNAIGSEDNCQHSSTDDQNSSGSEDSSNKVLTTNTTENILGIISSSSVPMQAIKGLSPQSNEVISNTSVSHIGSQPSASLIMSETVSPQPVLPQVATNKRDIVGGITETKTTNAKIAGMPQGSQLAQIDNEFSNSGSDNDVSLLNKITPVNNDSKKLFNNNQPLPDQINMKMSSSLTAPTPTQLSDSNVDLTLGEVATTEIKSTEPTRVITERLHVLDKKWPESMAAKIALNSANGMQNLKVNINPAKMGPIEIQISQTDLGINFNLIVSSSSTKDLLDSYSSKIQSSLSDSGLDLNGFDINQQSEKNNQNQNQGGSSANQYDESIESDELGITIPTIKSSLLDSYA